MRYRRCLFLPLLCLLILLLSACDPSAFLPGQQQPARAASGDFQTYALPQKESGLMRPAIDVQGRLWFGEMSKNLLGSFDPRTGTFWQGTPPNGKSGIMGIVADPDGTIWFAEQYADYIGSYSPRSGRYHVYPLPTLRVADPANPTKTISLPSAPNDMALDKHGILWFTELNANAIGSLNTLTGAIHQYPLLTSTQKSRALDPYGIAVDPQGNIWFTEATTSLLGRLNPASGDLRFFKPAGVTASLMEVTSDPSGQIWATTFEQGLLLRFRPSDDQFSVYHLKTDGSLYGVMSTTNGDIWVTVSAQGMLARLAQKTDRISYYQTPDAESQPLGIVAGPNQAIWFTEAGIDAIGVLRL